MAYTITRTDGSIFAVVPDGTVNTQSSMILVGKNFAGYGAFLNENSLHLLENGANTTPPANPQVGQLWWDKSTDLMKVYTGVAFKTISSATASSTEPTNNVTGDLWFNTTSFQLNAFNGSSFTLIGPAANAQQGTAGALVSTVVDSGAVSHTIVELFSGNVLVATVSNDPLFQPATPITGFANIRPGIQLSSTVAGAFFQGTATNADLLDNLNSTQFLRSDENDTTSGTIGILNDAGLRVGNSPNQATFSMVTANGEARIDNVVSNGNLALRANVAGTPTDAIRIFGANGAVSIPGAFSVSGATALSTLALSGNVIGNLTVTGTITAANVNVPNVAAPGSNTQILFNDAGVANAAGTFTVEKTTGNVTAGNILTSGTLGLVSVNSIAKTGANGVGNIASASNRFGTMHADFLAGQLTTASQPNITSVGTLGSLTATGNVSGGNLATAGLVVAVGNISGGNLTTAGNVSANFVLGNGSLLTGITTTYDDANVATFLAAYGSNTISTTGNITSGNLITGLASLSSIVKTGSNGVGNIGSSTSVFNTVFAKATSAQYADVAERFAADQEILPGTVVEIGGSQEIRISVQELSEQVFGVISTRAAYLMNSGAGPDVSHPAVAMTGRVPVRVTGTVRKGDRLVAAGNGVARAALPGEATAFNVIGRALEDRAGNEVGMVEAIVTIK